MIFVFLYAVSYLSYAYEYPLFISLNLSMWPVGISWGLALVSAALTKLYLNKYRTRVIVAFQTACLTLAGGAALRHWAFDAEITAISMILNGVTIGTLSMLKISPLELIGAVGAGGLLGDFLVVVGGDQYQASTDMIKGGFMIPQDVTIALTLLLFMVAPWVINQDEILKDPKYLPTRKTIPLVDREHWAVAGTRIVAYRVLQNLWLIQFPVMTPFIKDCGAWGLLILFTALCRLFGQYSMVPEHVEFVRTAGWISSVLFVFISEKLEEAGLLAVLAGLAQIVMCTSFIRTREPLKTYWHDLVAAIITGTIFATGELRFVAASVPFAFALTYKYK